ncbi:MAG: hypothetical protein ACFFB0_10515 [Promethearchaeota archaeon]
MSYIEKKYTKKINEIFDDLRILDSSLLNQLNKKSVKNINEIAKICAESNKKINLILKKFYPEIKEMSDKLKIKATLKFYYDLINKLTDLVRNMENFKKIDQEYYSKLIEFVNQKEELISGKYKMICTQELTAFYDKNSRENLERILLEKIARKNGEFFTFGSLEQEIKKIAKITGANHITIKYANENYKKEMQSAKSLILYTISEHESIDKLKKIGMEIKNFLESKKYNVVIRPGLVITNAELLPDE